MPLTRSSLTMLAILLAAPAGAQRWCFSHAPKANEVAVAVNLIMGAPAYARITRFAGELDYDPARPQEARVKALLDADSVEFDRVLARLVGTGRRPLGGSVRYLSRGVAEARASFLRVRGDLTLNGITKPTELTVERVETKGEEPAFRASARVNRHDFKVVADGAGLVMTDVADIFISLKSLTPASPKAVDSCGVGF